MLGNVITQFNPKRSLFQKYKSATQWTRNERKKTRFMIFDMFNTPRVLIFPPSKHWRWEQLNWHKWNERRVCQLGRKILARPNIQRVQIKLCCDMYMVVIITAPQSLSFISYWTFSNTHALWFSGIFAFVNCASSETKAGSAALLELSCDISFSCSVRLTWNWKTYLTQCQKQKSHRRWW